MNHSLFLLTVAQTLPPNGAFPRNLETFCGVFLLVGGSYVRTSNRIRMFLMFSVRDKTKSSKTALKRSLRVEGDGHMQNGGGNPRHPEKAGGFIAASGSRVSGEDLVVSTAEVTVPGVVTMWNLWYIQMILHSRSFWFRWFFSPFLPPKAFLGALPTPLLDIWSVQPTPFCLRSTGHSCSWAITYVTYVCFFCNDKSRCLLQERSVNFTLKLYFYLVKVII